MIKNIAEKTIIHFEPLIPVREGVIGERIFTREWQALVGGKKQFVFHWDEDGIPRRDDFEDLGAYKATMWPGSSFFRSMARIDPFPADTPMADVWQRRASVATSFVKWLGTNLGRHYLDDADKIYNAMEAAKIFPNYRTSAYAMAWARRNNDSDGQARPVIVAESYKPGMHGLSFIGNYTCSYDDIRTIEEMTAFLGTDTGQRFIKTCRSKIDRAVKREKTKRLAIENAHLIGMGLKAVPHSEKPLITIIKRHGPRLAAH